MTHTTLDSVIVKKMMMTEYLAGFPENIMTHSSLCHTSQTLITSRNKHVAHLMKVGHKRNKAAEVIRSATGHFTTAHTPYIGLWGEI